jgi:hypothetical protein
VPSVVKYLVALPVCDGNEMGAACDTQLVPLLVNTFPTVPGRTDCNPLVPLPNITLFNGKVLTPVPPFATVLTVLGLNDDDNFLDINTPLQYLLKFIH